MNIGALLLLIPLVVAFPSEIRPIGGRIIGGTEANAGQFPFIAAIYKSTASGNYFCSGTLISNSWVLTAAQCVYEGTSFQIRLGSHVLQGTDPNRLIVTTSTYFYHEQYDPETLTNDIGLIKFHLPITFTDYIKPVDYLGGNPLNETIPVVTLGWGQTGDFVSGLSETLNYVSLTTLSNEECRLFFGAQIADHMVCVGGNFNEGACNGDSGSPLILTGVNNRVFQVGISSFISANGCESPEPSGFTRVDQYADYITNIMTNS